jgi:hypothetical protein
MDAVVVQPVHRDVHRDGRRRDPEESRERVTTRRSLAEPHAPEEQDCADGKRRHQREDDQRVRPSAMVDEVLDLPREPEDAVDVGQIARDHRGPDRGRRSRAGPPVESPPEGEADQRMGEIVHAKDLPASGNLTEVSREFERIAWFPA